MAGREIRRTDGSGGQGPAMDPAIAGVTVVAAIGLLSDRINLARLMDLAQYWPLCLVGIGIAILLQHCDGRA